MEQIKREKAPQAMQPPRGEGDDALVAELAGAAEEVQQEVPHEAAVPGVGHGEQLHICVPQQAGGCVRRRGEASCGSRPGVGEKSAGVETLVASPGTAGKGVLLYFF